MHKHDAFYIEMARLAAAQSKCLRLKVGAVIVKDGNVISFGWNGTLPGEPNGCEDSAGNSRPGVVHAEMNALAKAARSTISTAGATIYLTHSPCAVCANALAQAGIVRLLYINPYRDAAPLDDLRRAGVETFQLFL